jgi:phosphoserine phosphatase
MQGQAMVSARRGGTEQQEGRVANRCAVNQSIQIPICVDLDGTLIRTDLLWEALLAYARAHPISVLALPVQLIRGRAGFKQWLADRVALDTDLLPLRASLVAWLREQNDLGRRIVLATASPRPYAVAVA